MADPNQSALIYDLQGLKTALIPAPRIAVVKTEWNDRIIDAMEEGVQEVWEPFVPPTHIVRHRVPGAFELPFACRRIWEASHHPDQPALDAILALGAVIRGGTPHFDYVCQAVTHGIS